MTSETEKPSGSKKSPWLYIGIGCGVLAVGVIAVVATVGLLTMRWASEVSESMTNPDVRREKALDILGAERLPDGFDASTAFSIPFVGQIVSLSDRAPGPDGRIEGFDEKGFAYVDFRDLGQREDLERMYASESIEEELFQHVELDFRDIELVNRTSSRTAEYDLEFLAFWGDLEVSGDSFAGFASISWIQCPRDERVRLAILFQKQPGSDGSPPAELKGTAADPESLQDLLSGFKPCK